MALIHYQQLNKETKRNRLFSTFLCGEQAVFYVQETASTPNDTSENEKEAENGEDKSNVFLWE